MARIFVSPEWLIDRLFDGVIRPVDLRLKGVALHTNGFVELTLEGEGVPLGDTLSEATISVECATLTIKAHKP